MWQSTFKCLSVSATESSTFRHFFDTHLYTYDLTKQISCLIWNPFHRWLSDPKGDLSVLHHLFLGWVGFPQLFNLKETTGIRLCASASFRLHSLQLLQSANIHNLSFWPRRAFGQLSAWTRLLISWEALHPNFPRPAFSQCPWRCFTNSVEKVSSLIALRWCLQTRRRCSINV